MEPRIENILTDVIERMPGSPLDAEQSQRYYAAISSRARALIEGNDEDQQQAEAEQSAILRAALQRIGQSAVSELKAGGLGSDEASDLIDAVGFLLQAQGGEITAEESEKLFALIDQPQR